MIAFIIHVCVYEYYPATDLTWKMPYPGSFWLSRPIHIAKSNCFHSQPYSHFQALQCTPVYIVMSYTVGKLRKCASH